MLSSEAVVIYPPPDWRRDQLKTKPWKTPAPDRSPPPLACACNPGAMNTMCGRMNWPASKATRSVGKAASAPNRWARRSGGRRPGMGSGEVPGNSGAGASGILSVSSYSSLRRSRREGELAIFFGGVVPRLFREAQLVSQCLQRESGMQLVHGVDVAEQLQGNAFLDARPLDRRRQHVVQVAIGALEDPFPRAVALDIAQVHRRPCGRQLHAPLAPSLGPAWKVDLDSGMGGIGEIHILQTQARHLFLLQPGRQQQHH